ncbi:hypothetical protein KY361_04080 [Candidatus Woesearchaeota archaeon]|nr:hypothetical protein [Candidatus Woesearchaeota archaeon]
MVKIEQKVLVIFLSLLLLPTVHAIGLMSPPVGTIIYQPGYEGELTFFVRGFNYDVEASVGGLGEYATLSPITDLPNGLKQFTLKIEFPDTVELDEGVHTFSVGVREVGQPGGMVGALTAVQKKFKLLVYSKEKKITANFDAPDANEKELMLFRVNVQSVCYPYIALVLGRITIYDNENNSLATFDTNKASLESGQTETLEAGWNNSILVPGTYRAEALVIFDGESILLEDIFKIGTLMIKINDYINEFISGQIDEFRVELENVWNNPIKDIYAELFIDGEKVLKSSTIDLDPWQKGVINAYWNVTLAPGEYNGKIKLYYADTYSEKNIKVRIKERMVRLSLEQVYGLVSVGLLVMVVVLAVIVVRLYLKEKSKEKSKKEKHKKKRRHKK